MPGRRWMVSEVWKTEEREYTPVSSSLGCGISLGAADVVVSVIGFMVNGV